MIFGFTAASGLLLEQFVDGPSMPPTIQWIIRVGLIFVIFGLSFLLSNAWVKRVETSGELVEQRHLAMDALIHITLDIVSELDEARVLQNIAQRAADLVSAPFASLFLFDQKQDGMRWVAQTPYSVDLTGSTYTKGVGVVGAVFETGKPIIVNEYTTWEKRIPVSLLPLDAFVGVPIVWKGNVIGTLSIGDESKRRSFYESDVQLLLPFADLASIAINNSRMYGEVIQLTKELEQRNADKTVQLDQTREELIQKTVQLQRLLKRLTKVQESERARISHDMHDSTTQLILAAVYATQAVINGMDTNPGLSRVQLQTVQMLLHQIEIEIRETIRNLRPIILDQEGVLVALKQYIDRMAALANLKCDFRVTGTTARLPEEIEVAIYRIVQEALQNITMHAHAEKVTVSVQFLEENVIIHVEDNGVGFVYSEETLQDANHFGLAGMHERADSIGASCEIITQPSRGTCVLINVPRPRETPL